MDWIEDFMSYSEGITSPELFRRWAAISAVSGALERRVWVNTSQAPIYPNMFILLVAKPGIGKSVIITPVKEIWRHTKTLHVAPTSMTKASLLDTLKKSVRRVVLSPLDAMEFHSLQAAASEFGNLVPAHDTEFLNVLNELYDNSPFYSEERRTGTVKSLEIVNPSINILAGTQPEFLGTLFPEQAWGMGFMSRVIMVYSGEIIEGDLFGPSKQQPQILERLTKRLTSLCTVSGQANLTQEAVDLIVAWRKGGMEPVPTHSKLANYTTRRLLHVIKLCTISAVSRTGKLLIEAIDVERARDWLVEVEHHMPDVFKEMGGKGDMQIVQDLHFFMWREYQKTKKPIHESLVFSFIGDRAASERIRNILELAERTQILRKVLDAPLYIPKGALNHVAQ
jgi:hypothetical protein